VQNLLRSLQGDPALAGHGQQQQQQQQQEQDRPFTTLPDLLLPATTVAVIMAAEMPYLDSLLSHLPPQLLLLAQESDDASSVDPSPGTIEAVLQALSLGQKRDILERVLRSPQFHQSLGSLTMALRDGGLPTISEVLKIQVANGGYLRRGGVPMGGGQAVEAFLAGIKASVEEERKRTQEDQTDTD